MNHCTECNSELKPGNKFCTNCGAKISVQPAAAAQCSNCGNTLKPGAKFCAKCGNAVSTASAPAPAPAPAPTAEEETAKKRFLIRVTGRGGEYAAVKATPDEIGALVNAYQNDYLDFVDMVDASSNESHHTTGVFAEEYELTVTDLETDEEVDLSEWDDDYHCKEALIGLDYEEFCVCCFDVQEGTFFEFEVEDDEFNVDKLRTKQIETRFGDIIVAFEYSDEPTDNFDFDAEGYETSSEETQFAIFDAEDQEVPIEAWLEDGSIEEEAEEEEAVEESEEEAEAETAKKRFLIRVTGRGGEYAAVKATPDEIGALVNAYQNDYLDFVDMVDASSNESHHTTGVFAEDYELTVTDLETDEEVDLSEWDDDYHCKEALIGLDYEEFCVCCFDVQEGTFFEFEVEDDEFNVDKLRTKQIETRFGDIIVAFEYSDEPTDNFDFDAEGYETSSEETQFAIFDAEDQEVPIEAWLEDGSIEEEEVEEEEEAEEEEAEEDVEEEEVEEDVADESGLNIAAMLDILMTIHDSKVFYGRNLDSKKVNNALGEYVSDKIEPEDVLVQVDDTVFGNAKDGCIITLNKIYVKDVNDTRSAVITPNTVWGLKKGLFSKSILMDGEVIFTYTQPETAAMEKLVKALNAMCGK